MSQDQRFLRWLQAARLVLSVCFCLGLALFVWLQVGTYELANRQISIGNLANGTNLRQVVLGETALVAVCAVAVLSLRQTWFTRVGILTIFIWLICLIDLVAFSQATVIS
jgi:protein-S-isoprenylcysteine O-methyltransferase Ste14